MLVFEAFEAEEGWVLNTVVEESLNSAEPYLEDSQNYSSRGATGGFFFLAAKLHKGHILQK